MTLAFRSGWSGASAPQPTATPEVNAAHVTRAKAGHAGQPMPLCGTAMLHVCSQPEQAHVGGHPRLPANMLT